MKLNKHILTFDVNILIINYKRGSLIIINVT